MTPSQVRLECRVWAWQWLLEEAFGAREPGSPPPVRPEASFLDAWLLLGPDDQRRQAMLAGWQTQMRQDILARHPNPVAALRGRIADLPRLLEGSRRILAAAETPGVLVAEHVNDKGTAARLHAHEHEGTRAWNVALETDIDCRGVTTTASLSRAERFMAQLVEINQLGPRRDCTLAEPQYGPMPAR